MQTPPTPIYMIPEQPCCWGPNGAGRCRTDVRIMGGRAPAELMDDEHGCAWLRACRRIPDKVRSPGAFLRVRSQVARTFRKGRVFIGGDAAHAMPPHMGQGSCCAMRDAVNLAWKLDLVLSGRARPELLDSYEPERLAHSVPFVHGSLATWAGMVDPAKAAGRDAFFRSGQFTAPTVPPMTAGIFHHDAAGQLVTPAGSRAPQGRVRVNGREDLLDNIVGFGFQLISSLPLDDVLTEAQRTKLAEIGAKVLVLGEDEGRVSDLGGTYTRYLEESGATALLSRPDFYVFGTADGAQATAALVDELLEQLTLASEAVAA